MALNWDIREIFEYIDIYQEHCGDGVEYYKCTFLIDFYSFPKGFTCDVIQIDSDTYGNFSMTVDYNGDNEKLFVPVWTPYPEKVNK
jgi:hypothetical protein